MLSQLFIKNVAVIESASIDFENGFNVFTGETGAGNPSLSIPSMPFSAEEQAAIL